MITLYHAPQSRSSRIVWLLEEVGQPYEIKPVSIFRPMSGQGEADPANPHPDKRVPAILHDGALVSESVSIALHLTDAFPQARLGPAPGDRRRGEFLTWLGWCACELEPAITAAHAGVLDTLPNARRLYEQAAARIEAALMRDLYVMPTGFSAADVMIASALGFGRAVLPPSEAVDAYIASCQARPAAVRARERDSAAGVQPRLAMA